MDSLEKYQTRRNPERTSEPSPRDGGTTGGPRFVIQKHDASSLHYDFRLEVDGVLKSWAVPRGPSTDPSEKRLALRTEDHPLDYAEFEGVIPEGEYGAGAVLVWDTGPYRNLRAEKEDDETSMQECIGDGKVEVWLDGEKLKGGFVLVKSGNDDKWLLIKMKDDEADTRRNPVSTEPESVLSSQTLEDIRDRKGEAT